MSKPIVVPHGQLQLDGHAVICHGADTEIVQAGPYGGYAWYHAATGKIILNDDKFVQLPTTVKLFVYAHECGHRVYGQSEDAADCFAAKTGRNQAWFPATHFPLLIQDLLGAPGDWAHRPGPARLQHIANCLNDPGPA